MWDASPNGSRCRDWGGGTWREAEGWVKGDEIAPWGFGGADMGHIVPQGKTSIGKWRGVPLSYVPPTRRIGGDTCDLACQVVRWIG